MSTGKDTCKQASPTGDLQDAISKLLDEAAETGSTVGSRVNCLVGCEPMEEDQSKDCSIDSAISSMRLDISKISEILCEIKRQTNRL